MKKFISNVRQQPHHIRHLYMWSSVVISFTIVGVLWFVSTRQHFIAAINPGREESKVYLAQLYNRDLGVRASLAHISDSFKDFGSEFRQLWQGTRVDAGAKEPSVIVTQKPISPVELPISQ